MVEVKKVKFMELSAYKITNGKVEITVVTDVGARIMAFNFVGEENLLRVSESDFKNRSNGYKFYGGHRLWYSPEDEVRSYTPDNCPCETEEIDGGVIVSTFEENNKILREMQIEMNEEGRVRIIHRIKNCSNFPVEIAPWGITQIKSGICVIPQIKEDTGLLPNRSLSFWSYSDLSDERLSFSKDNIFIEHKSNISAPFKIGALNLEGYCGAFCGDTLFCKEFDVYDEEYPDFNVNNEVYVCGDFIELETLSSMTHLHPDEETEHTEVWSLTKGVKFEKNDEKLKGIFEKATKC